MAPDGSNIRRHDEENAARLRVEADGRDDAADARDRFADERDRRADARDTHAEVRDAASSDEPDVAGTRRFAAQHRVDSAEDREFAAYDRLRSRDDRRASTWDRSVAELVQARLFQALDDADKSPLSTYLIEQAQGMLMSTFGGDEAEAMIEICDRADRDQVRLQDAARQILADGAPSRIRGIRVPEL